MSGKIELFVRQALTAKEQQKKNDIHESDKAVKDRKVEEIEREFKAHWESVSSSVVSFESDLNAFLGSKLPNFRREVANALGRKCLNYAEEKKLKEDIAQYIHDMVKGEMSR